MGQIREEYIDTGKVRFAYKHFAILGPESTRSAEASECAAEQDQFWPYHDLVFEDQGTARSQLNDAQLVQFAQELSMDTEAFQACLDSGRYSIQVSNETQDVGSLGVRGTPGFVINGTYIAGAQPFETFQEIIEDKLKEN